MRAENNLSVKVARLEKTKTPRSDIPFIYKAYFNLINELGEMDGLTAALILSTRALRSQSGDTTETQRAFVAPLARLHGVNTRFVNFDRIESQTAQLALVGIFQQVEAFVDEFRRERSNMGFRWGERPDGASDLKYLMQNLEGGFNATESRVGAERVELLEYYRLLRNAFVHGADEQARLKRLYEKVSEYRDLVADEYKLSAPNSYEDLTFDDYMLATRVTKYLATDFCRVAEPASADELIGVLRAHSGLQTDPVNILLKKRDDPVRLKRALRSWCISEHSYDIGLKSDIEVGVLAWIREIPTKRERSRRGEGSARKYLSTTKK